MTHEDTSDQVSNLEDPELVIDIDQRPIEEQLSEARHKVGALTLRVTELQASYDEQRAIAEAWHYNATHDPLTQTYNRAGLEEVLSTYAERQGQLAFLFCDGTRTKAVNDQLGHDRGDEALIGISEVLVASLRMTDVVARVGGDEFIVVLSEPRESGTSLDKQVDTTRKLISKELDSLLQANPDLDELGFDVAVGHAIWEPGMTLTEVKARAEERMYVHKSQQHAEHGKYR